MQNPDEVAWEANRTGSKIAQSPQNEERSVVEAGDSVWSPPQFSLKSLLIAVTGLCLACSVIKTFDFHWLSGFVGITLIGLVTWLFFGLYRLIRH